MRLRRYILRAREVSKLILAILIAPLAMSFVADLLKGRLSSITLAQAVAAIALILVYIFLILLGYTSKLDEALVSIRTSRRARTFRSPRILIMDGTLCADHEIPARAIYTSYSATDWEAPIKVAHPDWLVEIGPLDSLDRQRFDVVLNPFGEAYPEADPHNYTTFARICDFVLAGGVYLNVAGIPFWYSHDPKNPLFANKDFHAGYIQREVIRTGGGITEIITMRALFQTLFPQIGNLPDAAVVDALQLDRDRELFGDIAAAGGSTKVEMFRAYRPQTPGMIPLLRSSAPEYWLIGALRYGDGVFLLAGMSLSDRTTPGFPKVVAALEGWLAFEARGRK